MNDENPNIHNNNYYGGNPNGSRSANSKDQGGSRRKKRRPKAAGAATRVPEVIGDNVASHLTPAFLLHVLRRWWLVITPVGFVLAAMVAVALWMTFQPIYKAVSWVRIHDRRPHLAFQGATESGRFVQTQLELIRSPKVLREALLETDVAKLTQLTTGPNPLGWIMTNTEVKSVGGSELYQITFKDPDPEVAATVATAITAAYLKEQKKYSDQQTDNVIKLLERALGDQKKEVERLRNVTRKEFAKVFPDTPLAPGNKGDLLLPTSPMAREDSELTSVEVDCLILEAKRDALKASQLAEKFDVSDAVVNRAIEGTPEVQTLITRLTTKRASLKDYQGRSAKGAQDPQVQRLAKEVQDLEQSLRTTSEDLRPRIKLELQASFRDQQDHDSSSLEAELNGKKATKKALQALIAKKRRDLEDKGNDTLTLEFTRSELARAESVHENLANRILIMSTEKTAPEQASHLDKVITPLDPVELLPYKRLAVFGLGAFALPVLLAALWELRIRRISDPQEIVRAVHLDVLGEIAVIPLRSMVPGRRADERFERDCNTFEESIDSLRTSLMLSEELRHLQVFAVASAVSREGKTSLAAQLAISLANCCQQPTLLIDTDMRAPDLHEFFGIGLEPGLAQVLDLECSPENAIITTWSNRVHVLPAGRLRNSPHLLLSTPVFGNILREMRTKYRYIVIDAPPVLAASEAMIVAKEADGTLVCTMRDVSRTSQLKLACNRLSNAGARLLGAVFSGVPVRTYAYKYGGYDYYSKRYRRSGHSSDDNRTLPAPPTDSNGESVETTS